MKGRGYEGHLTTDFQGVNGLGGITMIASEPIQRITANGRIMASKDDHSLLVAIAKQRDHNAFAELYERHAKRAFNLAFRLLHSKALADDAVQEAMLSIWNSKTALPTENVVPWIMRIVTNKSLNLYRSRKRRSQHEDHVAADEERTEGKPSEPLEGAELISALRSEVDRLPDLQRTLIVSSYCAQMSHREIAKLVGIPQQTVTDNLGKALERLRLRLCQAGVVAIVPLLSAENLFEAITTGQTCPQNMTERMLERIANSRQSERLQPRAKPFWFGGLALPATLFAIAVFGAAALYLRQQPGTVVSSDGRSAKDTVSNEKPPMFNRRWVFEKGAPADITARVGQWSWEAIRGGGRMITDKKVVLSLPSPLPNKPLLLTCRNVFKEGGTLSAMWSDGDKFLSYVSWKKPNLSLKTESSFEIRWYCIGSYTFIYRGTELIAIADFGHRAEYICFWMAHSVVEEITLKEIGENDYPPELREPPQTLLARLGWTRGETLDDPFPPHRSGTR